METIKKSFIKTFLILLIANVVITLFECAKVPLYTHLDGVFPEPGEISTVSQYLKAHFDARYLTSIGISLVTYLIEMPFLCGVYGFCFARLKDEETSFGRIFYFYRSPKRIMISVSAVILTGFLYTISGIVANCAKLLDPTADINFIVFLLFMALTAVVYLTDIAAAVTLYFWNYSYASNPDDSIKGIFAKSLSCSIFAFLLALFNAALVWIYSRIVPENMRDYFNFIPNTVINWACVTIFAAVMDGSLKGFTIKIIKKAVDRSKEKGVEAAKTAAYNIGGSYVYNQGTSAPNNEAEEDTPFIEPYDFFIEADERFNDEKTVRTEDIRGIDILEIFDGMELAEDVRVDVVIRKKLKRMFDDLAFEIGEYVTYEGGREIENDFAEEVDEREFEVSVKISKDSDYEPFTLTVRVNSEEE